MAKADWYILFMEFMDIGKNYLYNMVKHLYVFISLIFHEDLSVFTDFTGMAMLIKNRLFILFDTKKRKSSLGGPP
ncbi:MAG TPA: hypothetical protein DHN33_05060 [Eubacteriaceae bacterium]|nr:hypothetical protein [Eubacteriaceae bacterium]